MDIIRKIRENIPSNPYSKDVFPMTIKEYAKLIPDHKLRTAISGCLGRHFWDIAVEAVLESVEETVREYDN